MVRLCRGLWERKRPPRLGRLPTSHSEATRSASLRRPMLTATQLPSDPGAHSSAYRGEDRLGQADRRRVDHLAVALDRAAVEGARAAGGAPRVAGRRQDPIGPRDLGFVCLEGGAHYRDLAGVNAGLEGEPGG